jgi:hypothetical protein
MDLDDFTSDLQEGMFVPIVYENVEDVEDDKGED